MYYVQLHYYVIRVCTTKYLKILSRRTLEAAIHPVDVLPADGRGGVVLALGPPPLAADTHHLRVDRARSVQGHASSLFTQTGRGRKCQALHFHR